MKTRLIFLLAALLVLLGPASPVFAQGTAFTYQGRLQHGASPANGLYEISFGLHDAVTNGNTIAAAFTVGPVPVSNGLFTVTLNFGAGVFTGAERWLEIGVCTNNCPDVPTLLVPRQLITATPYAITAGNLNGPLSSDNLSGTYADALILNNGANSFSGNGSNLTALNASQLASGTVPAAALSNAWRIGGNVGTTPATHFLGTTDTNALEIKVNGTRALRLEPTGSNDTVNVIGGSARNVVGAGVVGATIGGGGSGDYFGAVYNNRVEADFGTVSGGIENTIQPSAFSSTIGGGEQNTVQNNAAHTTIGGGSGNMIQNNVAQATIGGGTGNTIQSGANFATIGGGVGNTIQTNGVAATIPGGFQNSATASAFAAGFRAKANHEGAFVWADAQDADLASTANNQFLIRAAGGVGINKTNPATALDVNGTVTATGFSGNGAGLTNLTAANLRGSVPGAALTSVPAANLTGMVPAAALSNAWRIGGNEVGPGQFIGSTNNQPVEIRANDFRALRLEPRGDGLAPNVLGGYHENNAGAFRGAAIAGGGTSGAINQADGNYGFIGAGIGGRVGDSAVVGAGAFNSALGNASIVGSGYANTNRGQFAAIVAGSNNVVGPVAGSAFIGAGLNNQAIGVASTIGGGAQNISSGNYATVSGGRSNASAGSYAMVPGGFQNRAVGDYSFAAGQQAKANHHGAFVWADAQASDFASTASNQFLIRAAGNVGIGTVNPGAKLDVAGPGGTSVRVTGPGGFGTTVAFDLATYDPGAGNGPSARIQATDDNFSGSLDFLTKQPGASNNPMRLRLQLNLDGHVNIDPASANDGAIVGQPALAFGDHTSGEGIASKRTGGGNQWGLDFYTGFQNRMTILNNGNVGIGKINPATALDVNGVVTASNNVAEGFEVRGEAAGYSLYDRVTGATDRWSMFAYEGTLGFYSANSNTTLMSVSANGAVTASSFNGNAGMPFMLGTTDDQPLEFKVNNQRGLRLEPGGGNSVNVIGGWMGNSVAPGVVGATIGGGGASNYLGFAFTNRVEANFGTVCGGAQNTIQPAAYFATIGGGGTSTISTSAYYATIGGGYSNEIQTSAAFSTIGGGVQNTIQPNSEFATIPGGLENRATSFAFAAGRRAQAKHTGAFVWADSTGADFASTSPNEVSFRCAGGVRFTSGSGGGNQTVAWVPGSGSWSFSSDRNLKEGVKAVDAQSVLEKVSRLPMAQWNYIGYPQQHIGPMAQDFHALFPLNDSETTLNDADLHGVALAAIQGLNQKVEGEVTALRAENAELKQRLEKLEQLMNRQDGGAR